MATSNVFAGSDTTAASARALLYYVLKHPHCKERLVREILDAGSAGKLSNLVGVSEAERLPYFMACLWEALRFHPQPGLAMPRVVPQGGLDVNGHFLSKEVRLAARRRLNSSSLTSYQTIVGCSPWVIHKNRDVFGPDAEQFEPDRWLKGDASAMRKVYSAAAKLTC